MNFARLGLGYIPPDYQRSICSVLPTALTRIGVKLPHKYTQVDIPHLPTKIFKHVVFYFLDSLGVDVCMKSSGLLSRLMKSHGIVLTSVFPSITSTALCSIYTGLPPAEHGILGHKIYFEDIHAVVDVLKMVIPGSTTSITGTQLSTRHWLRVPPLLSPEIIGHRQAVHISPQAFIKSGISDMIYPSQMQREGYDEFIEGISKVEYFLRKGMDVVNFYQHGVDESSHKFGSYSSQAMFSIRNSENGIEWLTRRLPVSIRRQTLFVLVSDHGQNTFAHERVLRFSYTEIERYKKTSGLIAIGTSGRLCHVYSQIYPNPELEKWLHQKSRGKAAVIPRHISWKLAGGSGPLPRHAKRLGDYTLLLHPGVRLHVEFTPPKKEMGLRFVAANHGSLTPDELFVPCIFIPMDEII